MIYTGEIFRELAKEHNMSLSEFSKYASSNPKIDYELDARQLEDARRGDVILEGRLAGWLTKTNNIKAFKILLTADQDTRIKRIIGREHKSYSIVKQEITMRERIELERYEKLYEVNYKESSHYDLIIDTTDLTPEQIIEQIIETLDLD